MKNLLLLVILSIVFISSPCAAENRHSIDLSGQWRFSLDPENIGAEKNAPLPARLHEIRKLQTKI